MLSNEEVWQLIDENENLIHHLMKGWNFNDSMNTYDDVVSDVKLYLAKSLKQYDVDKGFAISTYMGRCINNALGGIIRKEQRKKQPKNIVSLETPVGYDDNGKAVTIGDSIPIKEDDEEINIENYVARLSKEHQDFYYACHCSQTKKYGIYEYCKMMGYEQGGKYNKKFKVALAKELGVYLKYK